MIHLSHVKTLDKLYMLILAGVGAGMGFVMPSCNAGKKNTAVAAKMFITSFSLTCDIVRE